MFPAFSVPGFPYQHIRLRCDLHWTNHFFETRASERYFGGILGAENIKPFDPGNAVPHTQVHRDNLSVAFRRALLAPVADGLMVAYRYVDGAGRIRDRRVTVCADRLVCPFGGADGITAELTTLFTKGEAKLARVYAIEKMLVAATDDDGRQVRLLPRPTDPIPMSGGRAIGVECHNPAAFGLYTLRVNGEDRWTFDRGRVKPN